MDKNNIKKAMRSYAEGKISMVSVWKFLDEMKDRKIPIRYDLDDIKKEIGRILNN